MTTHDLKTWPEYFAPLANGVKPFEARRADRDFRVGDTLRLREWRPCPDNNGEPGHGYTGREVTRVITYRLDGPLFGIATDYCVLGLTEARPRADAIDQDAELVRLRAALGEARAKADEVAPLRGECDTLRGVVFAPGHWRCAECGFYNVRSSLNVTAGTLGVGSPADVCPNDGALMQAVTWREIANDQREAAEERIEELVRLRAVAEAAKKRLRFLEIKRTAMVADDYFAAETAIEIANEEIDAATVALAALDAAPPPPVDTDRHGDVR